METQKKSTCYGRALIWNIRTPDPWISLYYSQWLRKRWKASTAATILSASSTLNISKTYFFKWPWIWVTWKYPWERAMIIIVKNNTQFTWCWAPSPGLHAHWARAPATQLCPQPLRIDLSLASRQRAHRLVPTASHLTSPWSRASREWVSQYQQPDVLPTAF